ncbi:hypothetical protein Salat_1163500 [Sesamum alatum]|uniref:Reverse transcriptase zinc-binding domain-containing protein n=1 Tax=Sesamum alatum TaxID=300844 RepID=A0AAE1YEM2_9LAMI|nr:hypothetical protein Salat_1163500 [Sesamum alatum]
MPAGPRLLGLPLEAPLSTVMLDGSWSWPTSGACGQFSTAASLDLLHPRCPTVAWYCLLRGKFKIPKHNYILWLAIRERLTTLDRPWFSHLETFYCLCDQPVLETHSHLFFGCPFSAGCVSVLQRRVRFFWPMSEWSWGVDWAWRRWRENHLLNMAHRATLAALVYQVWLERNKRIFSNQRSSP